MKKQAPQLKTFNFGVSEHKKIVLPLIAELKNQLPGKKVFEGKSTFDYSGKLRHENILIEVADGLEMDVLSIGEFEKIFKNQISGAELENIVRRAVELVASWDQVKTLN